MINLNKYVFNLFELLIYLEYVELQTGSIIQFDWRIIWFVLFLDSSQPTSEIIQMFVC